MICIHGRWAGMLLLCLASTAALPGQEASGGLRELAARRNFLIGAAVRPQSLAEPDYATTLAREFNVLVAENHMKLSLIHPERNRYEFADADKLVAFAAEHGMKVRGHTLVWHLQQPQWLMEGNFSAAEMRDILREHIATVVGRYKGKVYAWDVVNEAVEKDGRRRDTLWLRALGEQYLELAFRAAHEADPQAKLIYNDYDAEEINEKSDAIYRLVTGLKQKGVPVHGVGLQAHLRLDAPPDIESVKRNIRRLTQAGLEVEITEFDVRIPLPVTPEKLERQAGIYREMLKACLEQRGCNAFLTWGFTDRYSWIPRWFPGTGAALPLDEHYGRKPAYEAMREVLGGG